MTQTLSLLLSYFVFCVFIVSFSYSLEDVFYESRFEEGESDDWATTETPAGRTKDGWRFEKGYRTCDVRDLPLDSNPNLYNVLSKHFSKEPHIVKIKLQIKMIFEKNCPNCGNSVTLEIEDSASGHTVQSFQVSSHGLIDEVTFGEDVEVSKFTMKFIDEGACARITSVRMITSVCPEKVEKLIEYPRKFVGENHQTYSLSCVRHAENTESSEVDGYCQKEGNWVPWNGNCQCLPGYQPNADHTACVSCDLGYYKPNTGNSACQRCPTNSETESRERSSCVCYDDYARVNPENPDEQCFAIPGKPDIYSSEVRGSRASLQWRTPMVDSSSSRMNVWYSIQCVQPSSTACQSVDHPSETNGTSVELSNLSPNTQFRFRVCSESQLTAHNCDYTEFKTPKQVKVDSVRMEIVDGRYALTWPEPKEVEEEIKHYRVKIQGNQANSREIELGVNRSSNCRKNTCSFPLPELPEGIYEFTVAVNNYSDSSTATHFRIEPNAMGLRAGDVQQLMVTVGLLFAVLLLVLASCVSVFCCCRHKIDQTWPGHYQLKPGPHGPHGFYPETYTMTPPIQPPDCFPIKMMYSGEGFVEPNSVADIEKFLYSLTREIDESIIKSNYMMMNGHFGDGLQEGTMTINNFESTTVGLQHCLTDSSQSPARSASQSRRDLLVAAATCAQLNHPNVLMLHGVVNPGDESLMLVLEHAENGALSSLLREGRVSKTAQLVHMARGIACGMQYLAEEGYVHKVLKASNILVSQNMVCKISGFVQRAQLDTNEKNNVVSTIPVSIWAWTAPEVFLYHQFSWASDIWSFGVLLWEMLSQGMEPYSYFCDPTSPELPGMVESGVRLLPPENCPRLAYNIMGQCWNANGNNRPIFSEITEQLETLMKTPDELQQTCNAPYEPQWGSTTQRGYNKGNTLSLSPQTPYTISHWLGSIGLLPYENLFLLAGLHTVEDLAQITNSQLKHLGVSSSKHRKKMLSSLPPIESYMIHMPYSTNSKLPSSRLSPVNPELNQMNQYV